MLAALAEIQTEMGARARLEQERATLLQRAGAALGAHPAGVTLEALTPLMAPAEAELARARSAELRGLLAEIAREHGINRALMRQELAFLAHLTRLIGAEPQTGYRPPTPAGHAGRRAPRRRPAPRPGPAGLAMPISSFFGLQTSLRGLLAQQRALDVTATTSPTRAPPATRARRPTLAATRRAARPDDRRHGATAASSAPASTSRAYRRVRDQFLDLQYRGQNMQPRRPDRPLGRAADRSSSPSPSRATTASPNALDEVLGRLGRPSRTRPSGAAARQALVDQARDARRRGSTTSSAASPARARRAAAEYTQTRRRRRRGRPDRHRARRARSTRSAAPR